MTKDRRPNMHMLGTGRLSDGDTKQPPPPPVRLLHTVAKPGRATVLRGRGCGIVILRNRRNL
jgi:hypothetical protein